MAAVRSLGLHTPAGLPYLIAEGFLAEDPPESAYQWETYNDTHGLEEILWTDRCVVWSRGGVVKKAYSFDAESENVKHAVLTWFSADDIVADYQELGQPRSKSQSTFGDNNAKNISPRASERKSSPQVKEGLSRALVVFLNRQAHIYFLSGATHLVHLHFDVERVFPASRGLIIERTLSPELDIVPDTPVFPPAPPNSFLSPFAPRIGQVQPMQPNTKHVDPNGLDFNLLRKTKTKVVDNLPRHFCLTGPLSEVGLVVHNPQKQLASSLSQSRQQEEVSALSVDEEILYVSKTPELTNADGLAVDDQLNLVVTGNKDRQVYTIWQALYADSKSATLLFRNRPAPSSGAKTRRRSSFITQTGATTPAVRIGEGLAESFTIKKRGKKHSTLNASQSTAISEAGTDDLLASQLDPEYESRQPAKASRRVSSMLSRAELSTSQDRSAFQELATQTKNRQSFGPHSRRGPSLGGPSDRTSFGIGSQRRLRSSTPGAFSRLSLDDMSENGTIMNFGADYAMMIDDQDDFDDIFAQHSELDSFDFRLPFDGLRREVLFHRIAEIPMSESLPLRYSFGSFSQSRVSPLCCSYSRYVSSNTFSSFRPVSESLPSRRMKWHQNIVTEVNAAFYT
jgi:anaphase-promoting complex subunit 1